MYNVLLVDDEPRSIESLTKNIKWTECSIKRVYSATSMKTAIQIFELHSIDILICDIEMPNGSGINLLEWLREKNYMINCIFATCHPEFDYMRKAIQLKCYDYVLKPINYTEFTRILKGLVTKMEELQVDTKIIQLDPEISETTYIRQKSSIEFEVKKYIRSHLNDSINITQMAESLHYNPKYLMRIFRNETGMSVLEFITKTRMDSAKKLLANTPLPVKEVAAITGYEDYAYFTRVFKKECGISPKQFRKNANDKL